MRLWILQILIALDRAANAFACGSADETLSSRAFRAWRDGRLPGKWLKPAIDGLFRLGGQRDHCRSAYTNEVSRLNPRSTTDTAGMPLALSIRKGA
jgi:hypothetical protein